MKRSRRRRNKRMRSSGAISHGSLTRRLPRSSIPRLLDLRRIEDRRHYHPLGVFRPAATLGDLRARTVVAKPRGMSSPTRVPAGFRFNIPERVVICARRKERREVLFASGKGGSFHRPKRRNAHSDISCKR